MEVTERQLHTIFRGTVCYFGGDTEKEQKDTEKEQKFKSLLLVC